MKNFTRFLSSAISILIFIIFFILEGFPSDAQKLNGEKKDSTSQTDPMQYLMKELGINDSNLGFRPKGYWMRFPLPKDIPYINHVFEDLFAEPQYTYDFVRNMALSVEDYMHPDYLNSSKNGIMKVGYYCGVMNATSQFRAYNSSLWAEVDEKEPMLIAIKDIYKSTGSTWTYNRIGEAADFPLTEKDFREALKSIDPEIQKVVAKTIIHLTDAYHLCKTAMRNVNYKDAVDCWRIRHLGETQFDGMDYYPQIDNCAKNIDMNLIYSAGLKVMETAENLADTLIALKNTHKDIDWKHQQLNIVTPIGRIVIAGTGNDVHEYSDALLVIDLGGDDTYKGSAGANPSLNIPVSLLIDLDGDDKYINDDEYIASQGAGVFGVGMLLDMAGNDSYTSKRLSQGAAMFGIGIIADMDGDDKYEAWTDAQGAAYFGVGLAIDNKGDDSYKIWGDGQGYGGVGGVGTLINRTGNDYYYAEYDVKKVFRPDMHSKNNEYNYTYCQGSGVGRRGDVTDGHSWAGGIGTIIDLTGNDTYISGNWSQGCGYWYGMGFLYDGSGDDKYKSTTWSMACGAHFCMSAFIDEGGNDYHEIWEKQASGMGFGHDYTFALFLDRGGNDTYKLKDDGLGYAINMSQVFFIDTDGDDTYIRGGKGRNYGDNNFEKSNPPNEEMFYHLFSDQISIFGDLGGKDTYKVTDYETGVDKTDSLMFDGAKLFFPDSKQRDSLSLKRFYGIGCDFKESQTIPIEFFRDKMKKMHKEFK